LRICPSGHLRATGLLLNSDELRTLTLLKPAARNSSATASASSAVLQILKI
jgi:hypothetical protein